jgi:hypothetical protein
MSFVQESTASIFRVSWRYIHVFLLEVFWYMAPCPYFQLHLKMEAVGLCSSEMLVATYGGITPMITMWIFISMKTLGLV